MAYALVGSLGSPATGAPPTPTFGQATTAGNLLVAWVRANGTVTITTSSTGWALAAGFVSGVRIFARPNCGAGESAPTWSGGNATVMLGEFSGGATSSPVDLTGTANGATSPQTATGAGADAAAGELVLGCEAIDLSKAGTHTSSITYNNGASSLGDAHNDGTSTTQHYRFSYGITTGNAAADQVGGTSSSMNLLEIQLAFASFKLAAAGPVASLVYDPQPFRHLRSR